MKLMLTLIAAGTLFSAGAENLIPSGDAESKAWPLTTQSAEAMKNGQNGFEISRKSAWVSSPETVEVKTDKNYKLTVSARSKNPAKLSHSFIGLMLLDADKKPILRNAVNPIDGTFTAVLADANPGDSTIRVADASKWNKSMMLAVGAKEDFSDLPNRNLLAVKSAVKDGDGWNVELAAPLKVTVLKDSNIRFHDLSAGHCYGIMVGKPLGADWKEYSMTIGSQAAKDAPYTKFWPGTKYARFVFVANYNQDDAGAYFDDVVFEEI